MNATFKTLLAATILVGSMTWAKAGASDTTSVSAATYAANCVVELPRRDAEPLPIQPELGRPQTTPTLEPQVEPQIEPVEPEIQRVEPQIEPEMDPLYPLPAEADSVSRNLLPFLP